MALRHRNDPQFDSHGRGRAGHGLVSVSDNSARFGGPWRQSYSRRRPRVGRCRNQCRPRSPSRSLPDSWLRGWHAQFQRVLTVVMRR